MLFHSEVRKNKHTILLIKISKFLFIPYMKTRTPKATERSNLYMRGSSRRGLYVLRKLQNKSSDESKLNSLWCRAKSGLSGRNNVGILILTCSAMNAVSVRRSVWMRKGFSIQAALQAVFDKRKAYLDEKRSCFNRFRTSSRTVPVFIVQLTHKKLSFFTMMVMTDEW